MPRTALDPIPLPPGRFQIVQRPSRDAQIDGTANQRSLARLPLADLDFKSRLGQSWQRSLPRRSTIRTSRHASTNFPIAENRDGNHAGDLPAWEPPKPAKRKATKKRTR
jgi:hypothetical protein